MDNLFDTVYREILLPFFAQMPDKRGANISYSLSDVLKSGFAMFSLKSPSLFAFRERNKVEDSNLEQVYDIKKIPSDNGIRNVLDKLGSMHLREGFARIFNWAKEMNYLSGFEVLDKRLVVSIDGVEHFCSTSIKCPHCLQRNHRDGSSSYYHALLSAALVKPGQAEVLILDNEPIVRQDGQQKNDCERNAVHRLLDNMQAVYGSQKMVLAMDALYACDPVIDRIEQCSNWQYVIGVTEKGHAHLMEQFDGSVDTGQVCWQEHALKDGRYTLAYANGLALNGSSAKKVNLLYGILETKKGKETVFSWVTNIPLEAGNLLKIMDIGRSRWKIENEVFNTLKNQQYNFEHNYGHGKESLCTNFAMLMMLAFTVDQLQQYGSKIFQALHKRLKTKVKVWELLRAVVKLVVCNSMADIHGKIAEMYNVQLE